MKLVIIFGPGSVGKMTVGQELTKITNLRLFHNHQSIEFVIDIFGYFNQMASLKIRQVIFEEFVKSDLEGLIFTFMWALDYQEDWDLIKSYSDIFEANHGSVYYVELESSQEVRLDRNHSENRLMHKASKRDISQSDQRLKKEDANYRLNSHIAEIPFKNYIKINNEQLEAKTVAKLIKDHFNL